MVLISHDRDWLRIDEEQTMGIDKGEKI